MNGPEDGWAGIDTLGRRRRRWGALAVGVLLALALAAALIVVR